MYCIWIGFALYFQHPPDVTILSDLCLFRFERLVSVSQSHGYSKVREQGCWYTDFADQTEISVSRNRFPYRMHGFLKVRISGFLYADVTDRTDFSVFHVEFRVVRAIRIQKLVLSSDKEKAIRGYWERYRMIAA